MIPFELLKFRKLGIISYIQHTFAEPAPKPKGKPCVKAQGGPPVQCKISITILGVTLSCVHIFLY